MSVNLDLKKLRHSGKILASALLISKEMVEPGIATKIIDYEIEKFIDSNNARPSFKNYNSYPKASCISVNTEVVHGIPSSNVLSEGDLVTIDIGVDYKGHFTDAARTFIVGNRTSSNVLKLLVKTTKIALDLGIAQSVPDNRIGDISYCIQREAEFHGFRVPVGLGGHGVGGATHAPPFIPNYGTKGTGDLLVKGMCLAIEPIILIGSNKIHIDTNGWTIVSTDNNLSAHFEDTIVVGDIPIIVTRESLCGTAI